MNKNIMEYTRILDLQLWKLLGMQHVSSIWTSVLFNENNYYQLFCKFFIWNLLGDLEDTFEVASFFSMNIILLVC